MTTRTDTNIERMYDMINHVIDYYIDIIIKNDYLSSTDLNVRRQRLYEVRHKYEYDRDAFYWDITLICVRCDRSIGYEVPLFYDLIKSNYPLLYHLLCSNKELMLEQIRAFENDYNQGYVEATIKRCIEEEDKLFYWYFYAYLEGYATSKSRVRYVIDKVMYIYGIYY